MYMNNENYRNALELGAVYGGAKLQGAVIGRMAIMNNKLGRYTQQALFHPVVRKLSDRWTGEVFDISQGYMSARREFNQAIKDGDYEKAGEILTYQYALQKIADEATTSGCKIGTKGTDLTLKAVREGDFPLATESTRMYVRNPSEDILIDWRSAKGTADVDYKQLLKAGMTRDQIVEQINTGKYKWRDLEAPTQENWFKRNSNKKLKDEIIKGTNEAFNKQMKIEKLDKIDKTDKMLQKDFKFEKLDNIVTGKQIGRAHV